MNNFRGKSLLNGEWRYGDFVSDIGEFNRTCDKAYILPHWDKLNVPIQVDKDSVGQYTGLVDITGNQIFHADLIKDDENFIWEVIYSQGAFYAQCDDLMAKQLLSSINLFGNVIGNRHEHPNLISA